MRNSNVLEVLIDQSMKSPTVKRLQSLRLTGLLGHWLSRLPQVRTLSFRSKINFMGFLDNWYENQWK